jgi:hypothetical protein
MKILEDHITSIIKVEVSQDEDVGGLHRQCGDWEWGLKKEKYTSGNEG